MTDLEITKLCAEALLPYVWAHGEWNPLHDDAQAMALVKKFPAICLDALQDERWRSINTDEQMEDLNRIICECVVQMQAKK